MARKPRPHERALRADYLDYAENMAACAERDTNGVLWSRRGAAKRDAGLVRDWDLFRAEWAHVEPYMSEELREWFADNGRMTFTEYRSQIRAYQREAYADYKNSLATD